MDDIHSWLRLSKVWDSKLFYDFLCLHEGNIVQVRCRQREEFFNSCSYCMILLLYHPSLMVEYKSFTKKLWIFHEHLLGISTAEWTQLDFSTTFEISTMGEIRSPVHFVSCKQNWQNKEIWIGKKQRLARGWISTSFEISTIGIREILSCKRTPSFNDSCND